MAKSKVYFIDFRIKDLITDNIFKKLRRLMKRAGFEKIDFKGQFAALKIHFGEPGNLAYLRPNYSREIANYVKELGGKPFLTDCNTLYVGRRKDALDHLESAYENGYNPFATGCHVLIADGLKGTDEVAVPVKGGEYVKEALIGRAIMDADVIISITHFKVHELVGVGGTLKNIGMGCGSRAGKFDMHSAGKPLIDENLCVACGRCKANCAQDAFYLDPKKRKMKIDRSKCAGCGRCIGVCPKNAIDADYAGQAVEICNMKIAEYSAAVLYNRPQFHLNFVMDVTPTCDCHDSNDVPIISNVGIFASVDPVAIDSACADVVNRQPILPGSVLDGKKTSGDYFHDIHPIVNWRPLLDHAEKLGLGRQDYELIEVK